ncbi:hypothetical protein ACEPAI_9872 [Sanghuangporus weigelae]
MTLGPTMVGEMATSLVTQSRSSVFAVEEIPAVKIINDQAESPPSLAKRLTFPTDRPDILSKLQQGKDEEGRPMSREEVTEEAFAQLLFLCDNVPHRSQSSGAGNLQKELDEALGADSYEDPVPTYDQVKNLQYLEAVINEGIRLHSTVGVGLPRVVPKGGVTVCRKSFPEGTVLSIPMFIGSGRCGEQMLISSVRRDGSSAIRASFRNLSIRSPLDQGT